MSRGSGTPFARDVSGLPAASRSRPLLVDDGATIDLIARPVSKQIGDATVKMLGYDGSIPGPTLYVKQGSEATVRFGNETDQPTTVHWHGLRHDNLFACDSEDEPSITTAPGVSETTEPVGS
ncbi:MAG TPA: multicopper oxidase domain-containing protein [Acidimicrobiia bacterium]